MCIKIIPALPGVVPVFNEDLLDPVNFEPMDDAVSLVPCGHTFSQKTAQELQSRHMVCPIGREEIEKFIPNFKIRELVRDAVSKIPYPDQNQPKEPKQEGPSPKAVAHFERGKEFYSQGKFDDALVAFIAALSLYPSYAKAEGYLECTLEAQHKQANIPSSKLPQLPSAAISESSGFVQQQKSVSEDPHNREMSLNSEKTTLSNSGIPPIPSSAIFSQSARSLISPSNFKNPKESISEGVPYAPYLELAFNRTGRGKALCKAVEEGREDIVIYLLGQDTDLNVENENKTPLRIACEKNRDRILRILIGNGAQVNGEDGKKALLFAVENGLKGVARILTENGAPIMEKKGPKANKVYSDNQTPCLPLEFVAKTGDIEFLQILLNTVNNPEGLKLDAYHTYRPANGSCTDQNILTVGGHALLTACEKGHLEFVRLLINKGVKLSDTHTGNSYERVYQTLGANAFLLALEKNHENIMNFFIQIGIPLDEVIGSNFMTLRAAVLARLNSTQFPKLFQIIKTAPPKSK